MFDASQPPGSAPPGAECVLGYVGRAGETPHVWTPEEWRRFGHLRQFPCWVPDLSNNPVADAREAVAAVEKLGWARLAQPVTRAIILDGEARQFPAWYGEWAAEVTANEYFPVDYGSAAYVGANFAYSIWAAEWDGIPDLVPGQTVGGTQYAANISWGGTQIDLSVISASMYIRGGEGPREG